MRVPPEVGEGTARVTLKFPALKSRGVRNRVVEIPVAALRDLMERYPRIGCVVMGNLARTLSRGGITP